jgi:hypothetical protein
MHKNLYSQLAGACLLSCLCVYGNPATAAVLASSTFDASTEGWTQFGDATGPVFVPSGGNPGGFIRATDTETGAAWYFSAPAQFLGNKSAAYGTSLTYDLRQSALFNQNNSVDDVTLVGNGLTLTKDAGANPDSTLFTHYDVQLLASAGWFAGPATPATETDMMSVLSNLTALLIRGEFVSGPDAGDLDNVFLNGAAAVPTPGPIGVPEPANWPLLAVGFALLGAILRRRTR